MDKDAVVRRRRKVAMECHCDAIGCAMVYALVGRIFFVRLSQWNDEWDFSKTTNSGGHQTLAGVGKFRLKNNKLKI